MAMHTVRAQVCDETAALTQCVCALDDQIIALSTAVDHEPLLPFELRRYVAQWLLCSQTARLAMLLEVPDEQLEACIASLLHAVRQGQAQAGLNGTMAPSVQRLLRSVGRAVERLEALAGSPSEE